MTELCLGVYFTHDLFPAGIKRMIDGLPEPFRPSNVSIGEADNKARIDDAYFADVAGLGGHFLHAEMCRYDIQYRNRHWILSCRHADRLQDLAVLDLASRAGACFAYLCTQSELAHCHLFQAEIDDNLVNSWLGQSMDRFLPGFYWRTLVASETATQFGLDDLERVEGFRRDRGGLWFDPELAPRRWEQWRDHLDNICYQRANIFSLSRIRSDLDSQHDLLTLVRLLKVHR